MFVSELRLTRVPIELSKLFDQVRSRSVELQKKHFYQLEMCKIFVKDSVETL